MSDPLLALMTWLSPAYPVGAYTYSHGLDQAVEAGRVRDAATAKAWIADIVELGGGFSDAVFLGHAHRAAMEGDAAALAETAELAAAFAGTAELALESHAQGAAFLKVTEAAWPTPTLDALKAAFSGPYAYPVAVGVVAAGHGVPVELAARAYLQAFAANLVSAAVRLVPLGQTDGQRITAAVMPLVEQSAARALEKALDDVANGALLADLSSMKHETQHTRLFRS
ncbi:urease accessory protein UreF [Rhodobium gokarnense]|uniref:Urease accessory protein UreF n=1 Tax=Rhodobium gokarnense TaxID=364296 RepID=A0ABT3H990_9HYPH|nr:urease accessory protein UreF [Rhodobium gokarnense]MCW2306938.1 urease accessory protein [Rhodobium gokarnense]